MATQAAVLAGFTTTCLIEITIPDNTSIVAKHILYMTAVCSICANITCVSLCTITTIWGSGKALRGVDGSMDEAVEGISEERSLIFKSFAAGLLFNLCTVMTTCYVIMDSPMCYFGMMIVLFAGWVIFTNSSRIQRKFNLVEAIHLDDLTSYPVRINNGNHFNYHKSRRESDIEQQQHLQQDSRVGMLPLLSNNNADGKFR